MDLNKNSFSLRDSFRTNNFVYSESRNSHISMTEVVTQISYIVVCWVLYKLISFYNMFIGPFQFSQDI